MRMPFDYMSETHQFLYMSSDCDVEKLIKRVTAHLRYIPRKRLYRFRKCSDTEFSALQNNLIWLADPKSFYDEFDCTMPIVDKECIAFAYSFYLMIEITYKTLQRMQEAGEKIPQKDELISGFLSCLKEYSPDEIHQQAKNLLGNSYIDLSKQNTKEIDISRPVKHAKDLFGSFVSLPRTQLSIASFTTRYTNLNMWENYADCYQGFCVEYDFLEATNHLSSKNAYDILRLYPITYYKKRPLFDWSDILHSMVQHNLNLSEFHIDLNNYLYQFYQAITAKNYDYRAEQEWRLIAQREESSGLYEFPYAKKIYAGKNISSDNLTKLEDIAQALKIPLYVQHIDPDGYTINYNLV